MSAYTGQDPDTIKRSLEVWDGEWVSDPYIIYPSVIGFVDAQQSLGYLPRHVTGDQIFDTEFWDHTH